MNDTAEYALSKVPEVTLIFWTFAVVGQSPKPEPDAGDSFPAARSPRYARPRQAPRAAGSPTIREPA